MTLRLLHTSPPRESVGDSVFWRRYVSNLWSCGRLDTKDISRMTGLSEAEVYNILSSRAVKSKGVGQ